MQQNFFLLFDNPRRSVSIIKKVDTFRYLGSMITENAKDITTVKTQIVKPKSTFGKLKPVLTNSKYQNQQK